MAHKGYPSDVSDEEWAFVAPYLTLMVEDAPQREYSLRQVFNALRWMVRKGLTTMGCSFAEIGLKAVDALIAQIQGRPAAESSVAIAMQLHARHSVKNLRP